MYFLYQIVLRYFCSAFILQVAILHDDIVNRIPTDQNDVNKFAEYEKMREEQQKKIASLEVRSCCVKKLRMRMQ